MIEAAIEIGGAEGSVNQLISWNNRIRDFTVQPGEPVDAGVATGWWHWTAPRDGRYTWSMAGLSAYQLAIFTGETLDDLEFVNSLRGGSALVLDATGNTRYWIAVGLSLQSVRYPEGGGFGTPNAFLWGPTPANDDRAAARRLTGTSGSISAALAHATTASGDPFDTVGADSLWWHWTPSTSGWRRFWVQGHPVGAILSVYPGGASTQAVATSERSFLANGRVEAHVLARAGQRYDIRLSQRPGVDREPAATLQWEGSDAPAFLSYADAVTLDSLVSNPMSNGLRSPRVLAMSEDGKYLFSTSDSGLFAMRRDSETKALTLAYRLETDTGQDLPNLDTLQYAHLWWNARDDRLFALRNRNNFSIALPDDGSPSLSLADITLHGDDPGLPSPHGAFLGEGSLDGRHFYAVDAQWDRLRVYRVDSPTQFTLVQTVTAQGAAGDDRLIVPGLGAPLDVALSPDGSHLYLIAENGLFVFSREAASGQLTLMREISQGDPEGPLYDTGELRSVAVDAGGSVLFVSGVPAPLELLGAAVTAFDIAENPSDPVHLDTLTRMHVQLDLGASRARSHLKPFRLILNCYPLISHADLSAVDVFCRDGYYVVMWNRETNALEVTDFGMTGELDRFGNTLPYHLGYGDFHGRRLHLTNSPDGTHVYRASSIRDYEMSDAIHVFERAGAMTPDPILPLAR